MAENGISISKKRPQVSAPQGVTHLPGQRKSILLTSSVGVRYLGKVQMPQHEVVFLFDVDNTLLDNDRVTLDLKRYLEREIGPERSRRYWALFESLEPNWDMPTTWVLYSAIAWNVLTIVTSLQCRLI